MTDFELDLSEKPNVPEEFRPIVEGVNATLDAVIGPLNSSVAKAQIPISNAAGLPQCSPANTNPDLTKGDPAKQLRTKPNNYVRIVTTDDVQGPAASQYIYDKLGKHSVYIIDSTDTFGKGVADAFEADNFEVEDDHYVAIITNGKGVYPNGARFPVPNYKMKWDAGNPTGHGILFIGSQGQIYCYIVPGGV